MIFDLHTHTNLSTCASRENTYEVLLKKAEAAGVKLLSITDHNTVGFYKNTSPIDIAKHYTGKIIPGIEFSALCDGTTVDILAYNFDIDMVSDWAYQKYGTPRSRQEKIKNELEILIRNQGYEYDFDTVFEDDIYAHEFVLNNLMRYDSGKKMLESFGVKTRTDFYRISGANQEFPLYMDMEKIWPTVEEIVEVIHNAKGIVVFAHPYNYNEKLDVDEILEKLIVRGVDGVEVYHPSCKGDKVKMLEDFATSHNLIITGGSDYHGIPRYNDVGVEVNESKDLYYWRNV